MFSGSAESQFKKLPSFLQYCKQNKFSAEKGVKVVTTIWLPNLYESISFDTEYFRLRITPSADFYQELLQAVADWEKSELVPAIRITSAEKFAYILDTLPGELAHWEHLGESGRRITVLNRKQATKKRNVQNPLSLYRDREQLTLSDGPQEAQEGPSN